jgi:hypothetical protein
MGFSGMNQERTMQFILENLAAVTASQQQAEVRAARTDKQIRGLQTLVKTGTKMIFKLAAVQKEVQKELKGLAEAQRRTGEALADLATSQKRTDEKFNRWLDSAKNGSNGQNGHKGSK